MDILKAENIRLHVVVKNKREIFETIADMAVNMGYAKDRAGVIQGFEKREEQGSTGMQDGFAIPHVLGDVILNTGVIILRLENDVTDWETFDDMPVNYVIALIAPVNAAGNSHLTLLSGIAKILVHDENREALRNAKSEQEIYEFISSKL